MHRNTLLIPILLTAVMLFGRDITREASLTSQANPDVAERIRDGRVDWEHFLPGSAWLPRFGGWGDRFVFAWRQPVRITGVSFIQQSPPVVSDEYTEAVRGAAYAADAAGEFTIPVVLPFGARWREEEFGGSACKVLAYRELDVVTASLEVGFSGDGDRWSQLGEIVIHGEDADLPRIEPAAELPPTVTADNLANPQIAGKVTVRSENPWANTYGGSRDTTLLTEWPVVMLRGDTEQRFIAIANRSNEPLEFEVAVASELPENATAELLVAVPQKTREHGEALLNLFTAEQLASFDGALPESFLRQEQYRGFPALRLAPGETVRLWLRIRAFDAVSGEAAPSGDYRIVLDAGELFRQVIPVRIIAAQLPRHPSLAVVTYGGADDADSRLHYVTVNEGFRDYGFNNFLAVSGMWAMQDDLVKLERNNPAQFREILDEALERYFQWMRDAGFHKNQILVEILDEPCDRSAAKWLAFARGIKAVRPDARIIANPPAHWPEGNMPTTLEGTFKLLAPYVDVWMPYSRHYEDTAVREFLKAEGKPLWFYNNCTVQTARDESAIVSTFRRFGWLAVAHRLDGIGFWSAHFPVGDQWDDFDATPSYTWPDAAVVFRSDAGAVTTRHWESWRETVEDIELHRLIKNAIDTLELPVELRREMQEWLDNAPRIMLESPTPEHIQSIRDRAVRLLDR